MPACWIARFATVLAKRPRNVGRYIGAALRPRGDDSDDEARIDARGMFSGDAVSVRSSRTAKDGPAVIFHGLTKGF